MARLIVTIDGDLLKKFHKMVIDVVGVRNVDFKQAVEEAFDLWLIQARKKRKDEVPLVEQVGPVPPPLLPQVPPEVSFAAGQKFEAHHPPNAPV